MPIYTCGDTHKSTKPSPNSSGTSDNNSIQGTLNGNSPLGGNTVGGAQGGCSGGGNGSDKDSSSSDDDKQSTSEKDSESDDSTVKMKPTPSRCRIIAKVQRRSRKNRSKSMSSISPSKAGASNGKGERPKSMDYDSSEDEKDNKDEIPLQTKSKKRWQSIKDKSKTTSHGGATCIQTPTVDQTKSTPPSGSTEESDDIQPTNAAQGKFKHPILVRVRDHDTEEVLVSGSEGDIPRPKPKQAVSRSSGDELSRDSFTERPIKLSIAKPKPTTLRVNQQPPCLQSREQANSARTQESTSQSPTIFPFPCGLAGPDENHDLVQPMKNKSVLVLPNRDVPFCPDKEVSVIA